MIRQITVHQALAHYSLQTTLQRAVTMYQLHIEHTHHWKIA